MTARRILPARRQAETFDLVYGGIDRVHTITCGFYDDGRLGEIFISSGKSGAQVEAIARDGAVLLSLALQYGADLANIRSAITRNEQGEPSSIIGAVLDRLSQSK